MSEPDNPWDAPSEPPPQAGPSGAVPPGTPAGGTAGNLPPYQAPPQYSAPPPYPQPHQAPPGYGYYPQPPAPRRTNGFAIASLVLGILMGCGITSILAIIFGYMARKQIRERGESGTGMAIAGIILGCIGVTLGFIGVVMGVAGSAYNY